MPKPLHFHAYSLLPILLLTVISGGTGSIKLIRGLSRRQVNKKISVIINVGDNVWKYGLYICPDIDTIIYGLSNYLDRSRGWGIMGDTFHFVEQIGRLKHENWFRIGDKDLALHVQRTEWIRRGKSLTQITEYLRKNYGLHIQLFPVSDDSIETHIVTNHGEMNIQDFWVKNKARPKVLGVKYKGARNAKVTPYVLECIRNAEKIIIAPANPITSIGPSLAIPRFRNELSKVKNKVSAVSPIEGKRAFSGPAEKYMKAMNLEVSPAGVARFYKDIARKFIISERDSAYANDIKKLGLELFLTDISMKTLHQESRLATFLLGV